MAARRRARQPALMKRRAVQDERYAGHGGRLVAGHQGAYQPRTAEHPLDRFPVGYDDALRGVVPPYRLGQQATRIAGKIVARGRIAVGPRPVRHQGAQHRDEAPEEDSATAPGAQVVAGALPPLASHP